VTDWIKHDGGPQPVADDVWVDRLDGGFGLAGFMPSWNWSKSTSYRILNQHLIDAARIEGIRLGLEAAKRAIEPLYEPQADDILQALNPETIAKEAQHD
jgi:hypothetical protein